MNGKAEIFLLKRAGRLVKRVFEHWVVFVPTVRHERRRDAMIEKMVAEKFKRFVAIVVKQWRLIARRRARATTNARILKSFKDSNRKRASMGAWVVVWMRTKRAQNTVIRIKSEKTESRIQELESTRGDVVSKKEAVSARRIEVEQQLNNLRAVEAELSLSISDTHDLIGVKGNSLVTLKNEAEKAAQNLDLTSREAKALRVIENQRIREKGASERRLNLEQLKTKREVAALAQEKDNLLAQARSSEETTKRVLSNVEDETARGDEAIRRLAAQTAELNKRVLRLQEEEAREATAQSNVSDRLQELSIEEKKAKHDIKCQQERLSGAVITSKQSEVNTLRCRVAESERRAEEAVLLLREKEEEIAELQTAIARHQEGLEMKRLLEDSDGARRGLGLSLEDMGIGFQETKEANAAREKKEEERKRRDRMVKIPKMKAVKRTIREDSKMLQDSEKSILAIEEMGMAFDMALGLDVSGGFGVVSKSDDGSTSAASKSLGGSKNSLGSSIMDTPVLTDGRDRDLDFVDLGETRTKLYVEAEVEDLEESIDALQARILHRLHGSESAPWK